jgi:lysophospholipase L1-like esterase
MGSGASGSRVRHEVVLPEPRGNRSTRRATTLAAASLLLSFLLSLAALEGSLRVYHRLKEWRELRALPPVEARVLIPSSDPELIFEWNPGWKSDGFSVNSHGMPDREVSVEKPPGTFRIAAIGDSISANFGHRPRPEIYLNVLGRRLDREDWRGTRFEMLNFGVNGYGLLQSVRLLETRVLRFSPDLVIAQLCLNDPYPSSTPYAPLAPAGPSRLWSFVFRRLAPDRFWAASFGDYLHDDAGIRNLERGFAQLAKRARGGPPILAVLFPYLNAPAYDAWGFERLHETYRKAAREAGVPLLDLYRPLRDAGVVGSHPYPSDPIHPGREGHEIAASEILAELDRLGWLPGTAATAGGAATPTRRESTRLGLDRSSGR